MEPLEPDEPAKPFQLPVQVRMTSRSITVASVDHAFQLVTDVDWPCDGPMRDSAAAMCLKVLDGHRSTVEAQEAFVAAAREAGILQGF